MSLLRSAITYAAFPASFACAMGTALWGLGHGWDHGLILAAITAATVLVVATLERIHPAYRTWNKPQGDIGVDAVHALVSQVALPKILEIALAAALVSVAAGLSGIVGFDLWPHTWPLLGQLLLAMVVSQLGEYWVHRLEHETELLWRLHATHHSPGRLYFLNAGRFHPLDAMVSFTIALTPLLILGVGKEVVVLVSTWIAVHGLFQHCNVHLRLGPLNYIFSMAELHRWHHSRVLEEANANYGNNIILWDIVFGTMYWPKDRDPSVDVGLADMPGFPTDYIGQVLSPFQWRRFSSDP